MFLKQEFSLKNFDNFPKPGPLSAESVYWCKEWKILKAADCFTEYMYDSLILCT